MTLASDAMKGLNKAENAVNKAENPAPKTETISVSSTAKVDKGTEPKPVKNIKLTEEQAKAIQELAALKKFIEDNKLGLDDHGKKYVKVEVWQYLAQQHGLIPTYLSEETAYGDTYGVKTTCILHNAQGQEISRSTMIATRDEEFLKNLDRFAVMGLSETRAFARAVKNIYGYLLVALGFNATPWEEITIEKKGK